MKTPTGKSQESILPASACVTAPHCWVHCSHIVSLSLTVSSHIECPSPNSTLFYIPVYTRIDEGWIRCCCYRLERCSRLPGELRKRPCHPDHREGSYKIVHRVSLSVLIFTPLLFRRNVDSGCLFSNAETDLISLHGHLFAAM